MVSVVLPVATSHLPPAAYSSGRIEQGFQSVNFEIAPAPTASLVTVSAWLRGRYPRIPLTALFTWPWATLSIICGDVVIGRDGAGTAEAAPFVAMSTTATVRIEPGQASHITISLENVSDFTIEGGYCTLARLAVAF